MCVYFLDELLKVSMRIQMMAIYGHYCSHKRVGGPIQSSTGSILVPTPSLYLPNWMFPLFSNLSLDSEYSQLLLHYSLSNVIIGVVIYL